MSPLVERVGFLRGLRAGFPQGGSQWQVSEIGGLQPRWRRDSKELFYVEGNTLIAMEVSTELTFDGPGDTPV